MNVSLNQQFVNKYVITFKAHMPVHVTADMNWLTISTPVQVKYDFYFAPALHLLKYDFYFAPASQQHFLGLINFSENGGTYGTSDPL